MSSTIPAPPGYIVDVGTIAEKRFADPHPSNIFIVAPSLRGDVAQGTGLGLMITTAGERQNWSALHDDVLPALLESEGSVWTLGRVYGPNAVAASFAFPSSGGTIRAKEVGPWANGATAGGLKVAVTEPTTGYRRITVTQDGAPVATSPSSNDRAELAAWSDDNDVATYVPGTALPPVTTATSLAGGTDDRANITTADWVAAANRLEARFGPGLALAPGATDPVTRAALRKAFAARNRVLFDGDARGTSIADSLENLADIRADAAEVIGIGGTFLGHARTRPLSSEKVRFSATAALQAGNQSKVLRTVGLKATAFGRDNAPLKTPIGLDAEFTDAERAQLYAGGVNVITDDGANFATWGYASGSLERRDQDLHHQIVRMWLKWEGGNIMRSTLGKSIGEVLESETHGDLKEMCERHRADGVFNDRDDVGYRIVIKEVNSPTTGAARQFFALLTFRHAGTVDWAQLALYPNAPDAATI